MGLKLQSRLSPDKAIGQLIDAASGGHIWAGRFEGLGDEFDLEDQLTENIVATIEPKLELAEIERLKRTPV